MSNDQATTFAETQLSDYDILKEERKEMQTLDISKEKIIIQAANKLEVSGKYAHDPKVICSRICKLWPNISKSYITEILPDPYKRDYKEKVEDVPRDKFEEILFLFEEVHTDLGKISADIIKKCRDNPKIKKQIESVLTESIHDLHTNLDKYMEGIRHELSAIGQLENLVEYLQNISINVGLIKEKTDFREKLDTFMKIRLKIMFMEEHFAHIADKLHYSSKWISAIDKNEKIPDNKKASEFVSIDRIIQELRCCPACNFDISDHINRGKVALEKGLPIPKPRIPKKK